MNRIVSLREEKKNGRGKSPLSAVLGIKAFSHPNSVVGGEFRCEEPSAITSFYLLVCKLLWVIVMGMFKI